MWERLFHAAVYYCPECGREEQVSQLAVYPALSLTARCPRCSNPRLKKLDKRDHIEHIYRNPVSTIQRWLGAPILYCSYCRLQFYDFRHRSRLFPDS
ncbi:MAG: hypothetical protein HY821_01095 [Acidobacteria bacterium]|nr:hypothetical protein [Acidobacteriota bacterium]